MQHRNKLLRWAQKYSYPFLALADGTYIKHGLIPWKRFVGTRNQKRTLLAWQRVHRLEELLERESEQQTRKERAS